MPCQESGVSVVSVRNPGQGDHTESLTCRAANYLGESKATVSLQGEGGITTVWGNGRTCIHDPGVFLKSYMFRKNAEVIICK